MQTDVQALKDNVLRNDKLSESFMVCFHSKNSLKVRTAIFPQHLLLWFPTCPISKFKEA